MRAYEATAILGLVAQALGHGYIYRITADNTVYPGWDIFLDPRAKPAPSRISYGGGSTGPVMNLTDEAMACNHVHNPAPGDIAEVRAGSNITFAWSHWLYSHKGPITAWMAPYEGSIADVNVNELEFIKFSEDTIDSRGRWSTVRMMDDTDGTWTAQIPADIKPGNYVIRNEIIALHFAVRAPPGFDSGFFPLGPQFYMTCFNFKVTGDGDATPPGAKFPGAYSLDEPGFHFDVSLNMTQYPTVGPAVYKSKTAAHLEPRARRVVSPTGKNKTADDDYYQRQYKALELQGNITSYFDSIGG
ncbi:glycosyl hydrolase family 61-domain-containing protein [Xylariomycetidae sp. FL0641]|nr:glycosyl hydrolase family 61-domain-containing protein [Xylariomycetidae sp. FL0641]